MALRLNRGDGMEEMETPSESTESTQSDQGDLALRQLNDAAQHIVAQETLQQQPGLRVPRLSRFMPAYDVSADIQRDSTPLPRSSYSTEPMPVSELSNWPPDLGPWL